MSTACRPTDGLDCACLSVYPPTLLTEEKKYTRHCALPAVRLPVCLCRLPTKAAVYYCDCPACLLADRPAVIVRPSVRPPAYLPKSVEHICMLAGGPSVRPSIQPACLLEPVFVLTDRQTLIDPSCCCLSVRLAVHSPTKQICVVLTDRLLARLSV